VKRFRRITIAVGGLLVLAALTLPVDAAVGAGSQAPSARGAATFRGYEEPLCQSRASLCADAYDNPEAEYVGHDEPSLEFKSNVAGSGNDMTYTMTLPREPNRFPPRAARVPHGTSSSARRSGSASRYVTASPRRSSRRGAGGIPTPTTSSHRPDRAELHRQAPGQRLHGAGVLRAGLRPSVRGIRLFGAPVLRRDDHRQPDTRSEHRSGEHDGLRPIRPRWA
jgi:hypothetical protein